MPISYIDDNGDLWPEWSPKLASAVGTNRPIAEVRCVIEEVMGFICVRKEALRIIARFHPDKVAPPAVVRLMYEAMTYNQPTIILSLLGEPPASQTLLRGKTNVISYLQAVLERQNAFGANQLPRLLSSQIAIDAQTARKAEAVFTILREVTALCDVATIAHALLDGRYSIMSQSSSDARLSIQFMGPQYRRFDPEWFDATSGRSMDEYPDAQYGSWVTNAYNETLTFMKPRFERVDAFIEWPNRPQTRSKYRRLVVPFERGDGIRLLLASTFTDSSIDLRAESIDHLRRVT